MVGSLMRVEWIEDDFNFCWRAYSRASQRNTYQRARARRSRWLTKSNKRRKRQINQSFIAIKKKQINERYCTWSSPEGMRSPARAPLGLTSVINQIPTLEWKPTFGQRQREWQLELQLRRFQPPFNRQQ